ncbi:MAG TPA: protein phosphatase 2C domain-containing protein [Ktedonobacteraceae bacterium]|nr:protein phosphatase 2C domain-containing protein [Ktedonobacteraceae bacterium]
MSRHSSQPEMLRGIGRFAFSILGGLLLASQLVLPANGLATATRTVHTTGVPDSQPLALSQVAVVRLVYSYVVTPTPKGTTVANPVLCTSLGVLVQSLPSTPAPGFNTWVLTGGSLLNTAPVPCAAAASSPSGKTSTAYQLSSITVDANNVYTGNGTSSVLLGTYTPTANNGFLCFASPCFKGAYFFAFHTDFIQPILDVATTNTVPQFAIALTNQDTPAALPPVSLTNPTDASNFLNPTPVLPAALTSQSEVGMPLINQAGQMVEMHLQNNVTLTSADYRTFVSQHAMFVNAPANALQAAWQNGIAAYYNRNYHAAIKDFQTVETMNSNFVAAKTFEQSAQALSTSRGAPIGGTTAPAAESSTIFGVPKMTVLYVGGALAFMVLILLLFIVISWVRRRRELSRFKKEQAEAQRKAEIEVQQRQQSKVTANLPPVPIDLPCPGCGQLIRSTENRCPHCGVLVAASVSGLHLHAMPAPAAPTQSPANYSQSFGNSTSSISDLPTVEFTTSNGATDSDVTLPYGVEQLQSPNLSLAVGYLTDPGIKRKHKPNEDSLFAMQGSKSYNSLPQEFGLFVVADGMGGHANGQNASRMAIQTIIDYMLPQITNNQQVEDEALAKLLRDGVQSANQAVHQHNLEDHADMGTTMTAALVFGAAAHIANVGDSRTYLYREPGGLTKITHDHSVVASLVEAGIIQPDDIYTHPKRNQIYRSLGEKPVVEVDSFKVTLKPGDKLLLCSDGLWDMVRDPEIQRLMSIPTPDPAKTGQKLIQAALDGGGEDNVSVIVVSFSASEANSSGKPVMQGVQLLYKPETVTVPDLPQM